MRHFFSDGSLDRGLHYFVPRQQLIDNIFQQLLGPDSDKSGYYMTVWAPPQTGKTWLMQEVCSSIEQDGQFEVIYLSLQALSEEKDINAVVQFFAQALSQQLNLELTINSLSEFDRLFKRGTLSKPLILILDEFDALEPAVISGLVAVFRHIYITRSNQSDKPITEKYYLLHGLALIGLRAVLGFENSKGSPFNIQRNVPIPNLTHDEVVALFDDYQQDQEQVIEPAVVEQIWYEFKGQPGLTCWFGELLTETYNQNQNQPITMALFEEVYTVAVNLLPNNNISNLISKAKQQPYKALVLELFQTDAKINFAYDDPTMNFLYTNGVISIEKVSLGEYYLKFPNSYVQKRLFNYFAKELYQQIDRLYSPFEDLSDTFTEETINVRRLLQRYEQYLQVNREMVLKEAPRRKNDRRVFEAVFQFHLYWYLMSFFRDYEVQIVLEFPTVNRAIDFLIRHAGQLFCLELKTFVNQASYRKALSQAAKYASQLGVSEIWLVLFVEAVDDHNRERFEAVYTDDKRGVVVHPLFVQTGSLV